MPQDTYSADRTFPISPLPEGIRTELVCPATELATHVHDWRIGPTATIGRRDIDGTFWLSAHGAILLDRPVVIFYCADPTCLAVQTKDIPDPEET